MKKWTFRILRVLILGPVFLAASPGIYIIGALMAQSWTEPIYAVKELWKDAWEGVE